MVDLTSDWPSWGDTGTQPGDGVVYSAGDNPSAATYNYLWYQIQQSFGDIESELNSIDTTLTNIDSDGDGQVDAADQADNATTVKGNDIDSDGDGQVDAADQADNATTVKGNDIDSDGDGQVDAADTAAGLTGVTHSELSDAPSDAHHSEQHGSNQHNTDSLHNDAVTVPSYATKGDVPALSAGQMVYVEGDNAFYFEDGT